LGDICYVGCESYGREFSSIQHHYTNSFHRLCCVGRTRAASFFAEQDPGMMLKWGFLRIVASERWIDFDSCVRTSAFFFQGNAGPWGAQTLWNGMGSLEK